ncbi:MAG: C40 family peptidase [Bacteroidota bacterium]
MRRFTLFLFLSLILITSGCNLFRRAPSEPETKTSSVNYDRYSKAFGYELSGNENPELIKTVDSWLGVPYKYGGCSKHGTDCSCLIRNIYKDVYGIELPRRSEDIGNKAKKINKKKATAGDLFFFEISGDKVSHIGLHISQGYFVHASASNGVMINHIDENYYRNAFSFAGRIEK